MNEYLIFYDAMLYKLNNTFGCRNTLQICLHNAQLNGRNKTKRRLEGSSLKTQDTSVQFAPHWRIVAKDIHPRQATNKFSSGTLKKKMTEIKARCEDVRNDSSEINWVVCGYEGGSNLVVIASGSGGLDELKQTLADDQVQYGYLRCFIGDKESKRAKFVFISWVGEQVRSLERAKVSVRTANVKQIVQVFDVEVRAEKQEELSEEDILSKIRRVGGADYSWNVANN